MKTVWWRRLWSQVGTIRVRLTLWYVAVLAVILLAFSALIYVSLDRQLHDRLERDLVAASGQIASHILVFERTGNPRDIFEALPPGTVAVLYDNSGQTVVASDIQQQSLESLSEHLAKASNGVKRMDTVHLEEGGGDWEVLTSPLTLNNGQTIAILQVARTVSDVQNTLRQLILLMAIAIPATLLVAVGGGLFLATRALGPIDRIRRTAEQVSAEDLSQRIGAQGNQRQDELGRLAATFDHMLERLEAAFKRQRQFTADASHELRTPLALLTSQIDLALERPRTAEEYREALESLQEDATYMNQLLGELLTLARADSGQQALSLEPVELNALTAQVLLTMQPLAMQRGVTLTVTQESMITLQADQTRLIQLLVNLVDNALKYTPEGGSVRVSIAHEAGKAVLRVSDTGIGIAPEHVPHLFERFYRVDESRTRGIGGAGLGLSICKWIAEAHHGMITVDSVAGKGSTFTVTLPLSSATAERTQLPFHAA